jgi:hypothetical protein
MVYNFAEQGDATANDIKDSTKNLRHINSGGGNVTYVPTRTDGNNGNFSQQFNSDYIIAPVSRIPEVDNLTISVLTKIPNGANQTIFDDANNYWRMFKNSVGRYQIFGAVEGSATISNTAATVSVTNDVYNLVHYHYDGTGFKLYNDKTLMGTVARAGLNREPESDLYIGMEADGATLSLSR